GPELLLVVDALADVLALPLDGDHHPAGVTVVAHAAVGVADAADGLADDLRDVDVRVGAELAGHDRQARLHQRLHRDAGVGVLGDDGVHHAVRDLVGDLVG